MSRSRSRPNIVQLSSLNIISSNMIRPYHLQLVESAVCSPTKQWNNRGMFMNLKRNNNGLR